MPLPGGDCELDDNYLRSDHTQDTALFQNVFLPTAAIFGIESCQILRLTVFDALLIFRLDMTLESEQKIPHPSSVERQDFLNDPRGNCPTETHAHIRQKTDPTGTVFPPFWGGGARRAIRRGAPPRKIITSEAKSNY